MRRLVTFALNEKNQLPPSKGPIYAKPILAEDFVVDETLASRGSKLYTEECMMCHGPGAGAAGNAPDLRASPIMLSTDAMHSVVVNGSLRSNGMPNFAKYQENDLIALQHYVRRQANTPAPCKACNEVGL
jgi:quinohemoprotein ethanol dehydrogenase